MRIRFVLALWFFALAHASGELLLGKPMWGFDGTVVDEAFNILTIEVRNTGAQPFDGMLTLDEGGGIGGGSTAPYQTHVFLAPGATRAVQFYPFISGAHFGWQLSWSAQGGGKVELEQMRRGDPATVIFMDPDAPGARALRLFGFNEANFPPTVSATDALYAVVLDHQPRWDPPRREAFLQWLHRGGILHLIPDTRGTLPEFTAELAVINSELPKHGVGSGLVVKHVFERGEVTQEALAAAGYPAVGPIKKETDHYEQSDRSFFRRMSAATKPNIDWSLIYFLTFAYIALIGPAFYFQRKRDYRIVLGAFLLTVALFTWIFTAVGRRGYGEKQLYHAIGLARSVGDGKWDVRQWVHPFAISGDRYRLQFPGAGQLYGVPDQGDTVRGTVVHGKDGYFEADIPLFSSRPFIHQGVMPDPSSVMKLTEVEEQSGKLRLFKVTPSADLNREVISVVAQYGSQFYVLHREGEPMNPEHWAIKSSNGVDFKQAFQAGEIYPHYRYGQEDPESASRHLKRGHGLLARLISTGSSEILHPFSRPLRTGQCRLFTYTSKPATFELASDLFQPGIGYVLFVQDFTLPPL